MLKMQGFWLRKKGICATMKLVTKKCVMSKTMRQTSVRVLAHCLRLWKEWGQGSMNNTQSKTLLTEGSIWKKMVAFALPLFFGNLFQQLYNTADSLIVGNFLGSNALAAVSSSGSLIFLLVGFFNGIAMGAGVVIARYYGAREINELQKQIVKLETKAYHK